MAAKRFHAVYRGGVFEPLEDPGLPEGSRVVLEVVAVEGLEAGGEPRQPSGEGERGGAGFGQAVPRDARVEGLEEALEELVEHMAEQLAQLIRGDERLLGLYRAVERLEPGKGVERVGPPPLDNDTWLLLLSDVLTVLEKAGLFEETRPLRAAANVRMLQPYDYVRETLQGRPAYKRLAEATGAQEWVARVVLEALAEAVRRAVGRAV